MAHDRSGPDGLHMQAIKDSSKGVYRCLRGTPTVQYILHTKAKKWSAARLLAAVPPRSLLSSRHLAISPLRRVIHTTTPSSSPHRHALSSTRATHPLLLWARAPHPPLFFPPALPFSVRPRAASAPFFAPLLPPIRAPCESRCTHARFVPPCVPRPFPFLPPAPAGVFSLLLFVS